MKGLNAEPHGVLFHHFLEMTTESRWRIFGIVGEQQTVQCHIKENFQQPSCSAGVSLKYCSSFMLLQSICGSDPTQHGENL